MTVGQPLRSFRTALVGLGLIALLGACDRADPEMAFTASPALRAGDPNGAAQMVLRDESFRARVLANGDDTHWVTFHPLSARATQSLGEAIQPMMSLIESGTGGEILIPFGSRQGQRNLLQGVLLVDQETGQSYAGTVGVSRLMTPGFLAGVEAGLFQEDESFLGLTGVGALEFPDSETQFWRAWIRHATSERSHVFGSFTRGVTRPGRMDGAIAGDISLTESVAFALGFQTEGLQRTGDHLSITLSSPLRVEDGDITVSAPGTITDDGEIRTIDTSGPLAPDGRELRLQVEYGRPLSPSAHVVWQAWLQDDPAHDQQASTDVGVGLIYRVRFNTGAWRVAAEERRAKAAQEEEAS